MHTEDTIRRQLHYFDLMAQRTTRKAIRLRRKNEDQEAFGVEQVGREYLFKSAALRWVVENQPPAFSSTKHSKASHSRSRTSVPPDNH